MSFGQYEKTNWGLTTRPFQWEDKGVIGIDDNYNTKVHAFCQERLHIGREGLKVFKFCPKCMVIIEYYQPVKKDL